MPDAIGLLDALEVERVAVVGHDAPERLNELLVEFLQGTRVPG